MSLLWTSVDKIQLIKIFSMGVASPESFLSSETVYYIPTGPNVNFNIVFFAKLVAKCIEHVIKIRLGPCFGGLIICCTLKCWWHMKTTGHYLYPTHFTLCVLLAARVAGYFLGLQSWNLSPPFSKLLISPRSRRLGIIWLITKTMFAFWPIGTSRQVKFLSYRELLFSKQALE